ncbi:MAG: hypothetical protein AAF191_20055 [Verrucomicrobiota bacterium]
MNESGSFSTESSPSPPKPAEAPEIIADSTLAPLLPEAAPKPEAVVMSMSTVPENERPESAATSLGEEAQKDEVKVDFNSGSSWFSSF